MHVQSTIQYGTARTYLKYSKQQGKEMQCSASRRPGLTEPKYDTGIGQSEPQSALYNEVSVYLQHNISIGNKSEP
jgi:hypothetical protein